MLWEFRPSFRNLCLSLLLAIIFSGCNGDHRQSTGDNEPGTSLSVNLDPSEGVVEILRSGTDQLLLVQGVPTAGRPEVRRVLAPDGSEILPANLFWAYPDINGRNYFTDAGADHWQRKAIKILEGEGDVVRWEMVYDLLDEKGSAIMTETQTWSMQEVDQQLLLDVNWQGEARVDLDLGASDYGGMFLALAKQKPTLINASRQRDKEAEGKRSMWINLSLGEGGVGGNIALFDHPDNTGFPQNWGGTAQRGVGPVRSWKKGWNIEAGKSVLAKHRLLIYNDAFDDSKIMEAWKEYTGESGMYYAAALWGVAQDEGRNARFFSPQEAAEHSTIREGFQVNAWAAEPMITQPMAFCWDDRGRMWIAENRDYESRGAGFSNDGTSRILILEDTDRDGKADSRKVFLEGIPFPSAIAVGFGGLYLGAPPNLLFVPDRNGDDIADAEDIEVLLTGWGIRDRHETINSLHWGPDGWLYGLEGFATPSKIRKPEGKGKIYRAGEPFPEDLLEADGIDINGGVWRYHPTKDRFEVVAHGFSNPWGIDYDAKGQLFITACVIPHAFHVIPGGIYHRQGGQHFNPYVYSDIRTIVNHRHRSAHGGARIYLSDAFPEEHHGRLFMANIHEHAVLSDVLERKGSGFIAHHGEDFMSANNAQWIGFSMEIGPEGGLYVLDWHDADICGKDVLQKETGRVFRLMPTESAADELGRPLRQPGRLHGQRTGGIADQREFLARPARKGNSATPGKRRGS